MERGRRPFEDKVKKVQKAPRIRPLFGARQFSLAIARWKKRQDTRERRVKATRAGGVVRETREVCWRCSLPPPAAGVLLLLLLLRLAFDTAVLHRSVVYCLAARVPWEVGPWEVLRGFRTFPV